MKILGIDYGKKRVGVAVGLRGVIEVRPVLQGRRKMVLAALADLCRKEKVDQVVVGISEGRMARLTRKFAKELQSVLKLPVILFDETLTTQEAQRLKGRKTKELDSVAAAILLERFWSKKGG